MKIRKLCQQEQREIKEERGRIQVVSGKRNIMQEIQKLFYIRKGRLIL